MRDQQNPSTPDLHQPLLFAPSELLACGLRDAHHHPLVGVRTENGVRSWRTSPATAWEHPLVEWARTATSYCSIVLDCDSRESQELACAVEAGYGDLPRPNVAAQRATSGHLHLGWNLRTPVHRGAASRPRPLAALGRIAEYYAVTLRSDRGYVGVLAYNPVHSDYATVYPRSEPYDLAELARALPAHWRRPSKPADLATAPGRNLCPVRGALQTGAGRLRRGPADLGAHPQQRVRCAAAGVMVPTRFVSKYTVRLAHLEFSCEHTHAGDLACETEPIVVAMRQSDLAAGGLEKAGIAHQPGTGDVGVGAMHGAVRHKRTFWPNSLVAGHRTRSMVRICPLKYPKPHSMDRP